MRLLTCYFLFLLATSGMSAQQKSSGNWWQAQLHRADGQNIVFNFEWATEKGRPVWYIRNASERIRVTDIQTKGDSLIVQMPLFESQFRIKKDGTNLSGNWIKGGAVKTQVIPFTATRGRQRFDIGGKAAQNIQGRWAAAFINKRSTDHAVAEFMQHANSITGTFLNPTGDYRYLEGVISNDTLQLSCFDGGHAFLLLQKLMIKTPSATDGFIQALLLNRNGVQKKTILPVYLQTMQPCTCAPVKKNCISLLTTLMANLFQ